MSCLLLLLWRNLIIIIILTVIVRFFIIMSLLSVDSVQTSRLPSQLTRIIIPISLLHIAHTFFIIIWVYTSMYARFCICIHVYLFVCAYVVRACVCTCAVYLRACAWVLGILAYLYCIQRIRFSLSFRCMRLCMHVYAYVFMCIFSYLRTLLHSCVCTCVVYLRAWCSLGDI